MLVESEKGEEGGTGQCQPQQQHHLFGRKPGGLVRKQQQKADEEIFVQFEEQPLANIMLALAVSEQARRQAEQSKMKLQQERDRLWTEVETMRNNQRKMEARQHRFDQQLTEASEKVLMEFELLRHVRRNQWAALGELLTRREIGEEELEQLRQRVERLDDTSQDNRNLNEHIEFWTQRHSHAVSLGSKLDEWQLQLNHLQLEGTYLQRQIQVVDDRATFALGQAQTALNRLMQSRQWQLASCFGSNGNLFGGFFFLESERPTNDSDTPSSSQNCGQNVVTTTVQQSSPLCQSGVSSSITNKGTSVHPGGALSSEPPAKSTVSAISAQQKSIINRHWPPPPYRHGVSFSPAAGYNNYCSSNIGTIINPVRVPSALSAGSKSSSARITSAVSTTTSVYHTSFPFFQMERQDLCKDEAILARRNKDLQLMKEQPHYKRYINIIPKSERGPNHPRTPVKEKDWSRRSWDSQVKLWKKKVHNFVASLDRQSSRQNTFFSMPSSSVSSSSFLIIASRWTTFCHSLAHRLEPPSPYHSKLFVLCPYFAGEENCAFWKQSECGTMCIEFVSHENVQLVAELVQQNQIRTLFLLLTEDQCEPLRVLLDSLVNCCFPPTLCTVVDVK